VVLAHDRDRRHRIRGGRDAGGVDLLELIEVGEDVAKLLRQALCLRYGQLKMRQRGDPLDLGRCQSCRHG
jgi:hypothetical protein